MKEYVWYSLLNTGTFKSTPPMTKNHLLKLSTILYLIWLTTNVWLVAIKYKFPLLYMPMKAIIFLVGKKVAWDKWVAFLHQCLSLSLSPFFFLCFCSSEKQWFLIDQRGLMISFDHLCAWMTYNLHTSIQYLKDIFPINFIILHQWQCLAHGTFCTFLQSS